MRNLFVLLLLAVSLSGHAQIIDSFPMPPLSFDQNGDLVIKASPGSSGHDFDFFLGKWKFKNEHLNSRLTNCKEYTELEFRSLTERILAGAGNQDITWRTVNGKAWESRTIRLFDKQTRLWRIYWADNNMGEFDPPQIGSFDGNIGLFYSRQLWKGRPVIVVFKWDKTNPEQSVWRQAFSPDNGRTWEWNETITCYRIK